MPALTLAASGRGRAFSITRTPGGSRPTEPGRFAITTTSSTCGASAGERALELGRMPVRDDDGGDAHRPSASR